MHIEQVTLHSYNLTKQRSFYGDILGFEIIDIEDGFKIKTGLSEIIFLPSTDSSIYHFAWNIPINKLKEAIAWCKERLTLITYEDKIVQNFEGWNADAIYFYDADGNILEFIARYNTQPESNEKFGIASILSLCEMAIVVDDIVPIYGEMKRQCDIPIYSGNMTRFCAAGDENGMFIIVNKNEKDFWFPTGDLAEIKSFNCVVSSHGQLFDVGYSKEGNLKIQSQ